ncbi:MAG TPA: B12-binding domain-containing radical SAM protein, partial [Nitrospiraceae bacterium]|nr:B12-binding domain-containing radical SAM protein [Nitrospiraceae bacterium]
MNDTLIEIGRGVSTDKPRRNFKTMLLFPPEWVPTAPYLALPSLTAVLRSYGHQVVQKDVNIEMYDWFFSDTFLIWVKLRMDQQRRDLKEREARNELTDLERDRLACLASQDALDVMELAEQAAEAKAIVRGEMFYDAEKLEWALKVFRDVMQFISAAYFPASLVFYPMESNLGYRSGVSTEVLACLDDDV